MKKYIGMVGLLYREDGIRTGRYVMAFHSTAKDLKETFLPDIPIKDIYLIKTAKTETYEED